MWWIGVMKSEIVNGFSLSYGSYLDIDGWFD